MDGAIRELIRDVAKFPHSVIGEDLPFEDAVIIWKAVGYFIRENLRKDRCVLIPGVGRVGVFEVRIPFAHNPPRFLCRKTPYFRPSSQLPTRNSAHHSSIRLEIDSHPEVTLNPCSVARLCGHRRRSVVTCLQEVTSHLHRCVASGGTRLPLQAIGTVVFAGAAARMDFDGDLLREIQEVDVSRELC